MYCASVIEPWINFYFPQEEVPPIISQCCYFRCPTPIDICAHKVHFTFSSAHPYPVSKAGFLYNGQGPWTWWRWQVWWIDLFSSTTGQCLDSITLNFLFPVSQIPLRPWLLAPLLLPSTLSWTAHQKAILDVLVVKHSRLFSLLMVHKFLKAIGIVDSLPFPSTSLLVFLLIPQSLLNLFSFPFFQFLYHCFLHRLLVC